MKWLSSAIVVILSIGLVGCNRASTPGGPGASTTTKTEKSTNPSTGESSSKTTTTTAADEPAKTFKLTAPVLATKLKQGETKQVTIGLDRGSKFEQDVTLKFENVPKGISVESAPIDVKRSEKEAKFSIKAGEDAPVGTHTVTVIGQPTTGVAASNEFKITIEQK